MSQKQRLIVVSVCLLAGLAFLGFGWLKKPSVEPVTSRAFDCSVEPAMTDYRQKQVAFVAQSVRGKPIPQAVIALEIDRSGTVWSAELVKGGDGDPTWDFVRNLMSLRYQSLPEHYRAERFGFCIDTKELL